MSVQNLYHADFFIYSYRKALDVQRYCVFILNDIGSIDLAWPPIYISKKNRMKLAAIMVVHAQCIQCSHQEVQRNMTTRFGFISKPCLCHLSTLYAKAFATTLHKHTNYCRPSKVFFLPTLFEYRPIYGQLHDNL